jgi:hypothetical protein
MHGQTIDQEHQKGWYSITESGASFIWENTLSPKQRRVVHQTSMIIDEKLIIVE